MLSVGVSTVTDFMRERGCDCVRALKWSEITHRITTNDRHRLNRSTGEAYTRVTPNHADSESTMTTTVSKMTESLVAFLICFAFLDLHSLLLLQVACGAAGVLGTVAAITSITDLSSCTDLAQELATKLEARAPTDEANQGKEGLEGKGAQELFETLSEKLFERYDLDSSGRY